MEQSPRPLRRRPMATGHPQANTARTAFTAAAEAATELGSDRNSCGATSAIRLRYQPPPL